MVTFKEVAAEAGVSPATVSYTLRGGEHVSAKTRAKVERAAAKLGYVPNPVARNLRKGRTGIIELVAHELDKPFFYSKLADAVADACANAGYQGLVMKAGSDPDRVRRAADRLANQSCDGIILEALGIEAKEIKALSRNRPTVLIDDPHAQPVLDTVMTPHIDGIRTAVTHLHQHGCERIGIVGGDKFIPYDRMRTMGDAAPPRLLGFAEATLGLGLEYSEDRVFPAQWTIEPGRRAADDVLARGRTLDGLVCTTDAVAIGLIRGLADHGVHVPDDVKVIGFDGISIGEFTVPSLSTIAVDMPDMAAKAVELLRSRIAGEYDGEPRRLTADFTLVERESSQ